MPSAIIVSAHAQTPIAICNKIPKADTHITSISLGRCGAKISHGRRRISQYSMTQNTLPATTIEKTSSTDPSII